MHSCGEIRESVAILSELYPSLVTPNAKDYHVDWSRIHKCEGKVAGICFNCCTIMIKQHFYAVWLGSGKMDGLQCYLFSGSQVLGTAVIHCCLDLHEARRQDFWVSSISFLLKYNQTYRLCSYSCSLECFHLPNNIVFVNWPATFLSFSLSFYCFRWKLNGTEINPRSRSHYSLSGGNLRISHLNKDQDAGTYQCLASNSFGTIVSREASLTFACKSLFFLLLSG